MKESTPILSRCYIDHITAAFKAFSEKACLVIKRNGNWKKWSYSDMQKSVVAVQKALETIGVTKDDNSLIIGDNVPEWIIAYHGIVLNGGCVVPVDPNLPLAEIDAITKTVRPKIVFCSSLFKDFFGKLSETVPIAKVVIIPSGPDEDESDFIDFSDNSQKISGRIAEHEFNSHTFSENDPFAILFTSGTTGTPKGAVLLQKNLVPLMHHGASWMQLTKNDTAVAVLPLHHVFGFAACCAAPIAAGMTVAFMPVPKGHLLLECIRENKVSMLPAVPQMLELFLQNINRGVASKGIVVSIIFRFLHMISAIFGTLFGISFRRKLFASVHAQFGGSLKLIVSGGSSIRKSTFMAFRRMGFNIAEGYGLTETFGPITLSPVHDARVGSVGKTFPGNKVVLVNKDSNGNGELRFSGDTIFGGYYNMPQATAESFDENGYFITGDTGKITKDGFVYITGRTKDIIVLGSGKNVYPDELENEYLRSHLIEEIGIFGLKQNETEIVAAVIVPAIEVRRRHSRNEAKDIIANELQKISDKWPSYRKISEWAVTFHPLPRTSTKKIRKNEVRDIFFSLKDGVDKIKAQKSVSIQEKELMERESYQRIAAIIMELSPTKENMHPKALLEADLGLDSLRKAELFSRIEAERGCAMDSSEWDKIETVSDCVMLCEAKKETNVIDSKRFVIENKFAYGLILRLVSPIIRKKASFFWGLKIEKSSLNIPDGPIIFYANHESVIDPVLVLASLPWSIRKKTFAIGKAELLNFPVLSHLLSLAHLIPVDRYGDPRSAISAGREILGKGYNLLIFPEGTRSHNGELGAFKSGAAKLAKEANVALVPIRLFNTGVVWPASELPKLFCRKKPLRVIFGKPIIREEIKDTSSIEEVSNVLKKRLIEIEFP